MSKKEIRWLDNVLGIDVRDYIKKARIFLKLPKICFVYDKEKLINLATFIEKLELVYERCKSLEVFRDGVTDGRFVEYRKFIEQAPDVMREKLKEAINYVS